ncbi:MAG: CDP-Glycerol:Poly(glycerophosphate) glycerophosphotransferase [Firmicutes bacterium ADurb.Bin080]|nr:MAG: CDP-Glycerol:Poly(glycerophosphate) glycerophosphotransferase [Firmicutes bacterium ADurb.Bin080]
MKQIGFFIQTNNPLSGDQLILLKLARYLSCNENYKVYYINNFFEKDKKYYGGSNIIFIENNKFDEGIFEEAVFITPVNYLANLVVKIKNLKTAKICLFSYSSDSISWLSNNLGDKKAIDNLKRLISESQSCAYMDPSCTFDIKDNMNINKEILIPKCIDTELSERKGNKPVTQEDGTIRIAYYGNIDAQANNFLENLFRNFKSLRISKKVKVSLIGKIIDKNFPSSVFSTTMGLAVLIFPGDLEGRELYEYLTENIDIVFATDYCSLEAANCRMPVVIPIMQEKSYVENRYVWLNEIDKYIYHWNKELLSYLDYDTHTLKRIIETIYEKNEGNIIANNCFEYVKRNASTEFCCKKLLELMSKTELTVEKCLNSDAIANCVYDYDKYKKEYNKDFNSFIVYRNNGNRELIDPKALSDTKKRIESFSKIQNTYNQKIKAIRKQKIIKVGFIVIFKSTFPTRTVFEVMRRSTLFDPYIIVVPNIFSSRKTQDEVFEDTYNTFKTEYGERVIPGYNSKNNEYLDIGNEFSILFFANPYKHLVHKYHDLNYFLDKNVLPVYANYGFAAIKFWDEIINMDFYNSVWKVCIENNSNYEYMKKQQAIKGVNSIVTGYLKMDLLANEKIITKTRPVVLICPHHTVYGWKKLNISNFLRYSDFFAKLPQQYPSIDFVFRPHPLLFSNLESHKIWSSKTIENYIAKMKSFSNVIYDTSDNYFDKFINSDAMIHDCGSFIAEYLYTEKPCCYLMKSKEETYSGLLPFGQKCMDYHYHALCETEIIKFLDEVVLGGKDPVKKSREDFVRNELKVNYPHAAHSFVEYIAKQLKRNNKFMNE